MSEESPRPSQPGYLLRSWRWFAHLHERDTVKTLAALAGIAALVFAAFTLFEEPNSSTASPTTTQSPAADATDPPVGIASPTPDAAEPSEPSQCWTATGGAVSCSQPHAVEVVAIELAECSQESLVRLMGGDPRLDVTWVAVGAQPVGTSEACVASASEEWSGPLGDAFRGSAADALRLCEDTRSAARTVGCNVAHTVEAVGPTQGERSVADCAAEVADYTGVPADLLDARLKVLLRTSVDGGTAACAIGVSGGDVLTSSLRSIGSKAIPITAG